MPTYGYRCESCGTEFDVWQRMADEAKADCPQCGCPARRLFFPAGIVFKGTGFYKTDSRKAGSDGGSTTSTTKTAASSDTAASPSEPGGSKSAKPSSSSSSGSTPSAPATASSGGD